MTCRISTNLSKNIRVYQQPAQLSKQWQFCRQVELLSPNLKVRRLFSENSNSKDLTKTSFVDRFLDFFDKSIKYLFEFKTNNKDLTKELGFKIKIDPVLTELTKEKLKTLIPIHCKQKLIDYYYILPESLPFNNSQGILNIDEYYKIRSIVDSHSKQIQTTLHSRKISRDNQGKPICIGVQKVNIEALEYIRRILICEIKLEEVAILTTLQSKFFIDGYAISIDNVVDRDVPIGDFIKIDFSQPKSTPLSSIERNEEFVKCDEFVRRELKIEHFTHVPSPYLILALNTKPLTTSQD